MKSFILYISALNYMPGIIANAVPEEFNMEECKAACRGLANSECNCMPENVNSITPEEEAELDELNNEIDCLENCPNNETNASITPNGNTNNQRNVMFPGINNQLPENNTSNMPGTNNIRCDKNGNNCVNLGNNAKVTSPAINYDEGIQCDANGNCRAISNLQPKLKCDQNGNNCIPIENVPPHIQCDQNGNNCVTVSNNLGSGYENGYHTELAKSPIPVLVPNSAEIPFPANQTITLKDKITAIVTSLITSFVPSPPVVVTQAPATVTFTKHEKPLTTTLPPLVFQIPTTVYRTSKPEIVEKTLPPQIIYQPPVTSTVHHQIEYPPSTLVISTTLPPVIRTMLVPGPVRTVTTPPQTIVKISTSIPLPSTVVVQKPPMTSTLTMPVFVTQTSKLPPETIKVPIPVTITKEAVPLPPQTVTVPVRVPVTVIQTSPPQVVTMQNTVPVPVTVIQQAPKSPAETVTVQVPVTTIQTLFRTVRHPSQPTAAQTETIRIVQATGSNTGDVISQALNRIQPNNYTNQINNSNGRQMQNLVPNNPNFDDEMNISGLMPNISNPFYNPGYGNGKQSGGSSRPGANHNSYNLLNGSYRMPSGNNYMQYMNKMNNGSEYGGMECDCEEQNYQRQNNYNNCECNTNYQAPRMPQPYPRQRPRIRQQKQPQFQARMIPPVPIEQQECNCETPVFESLFRVPPACDCPMPMLPLYNQQAKVRRIGPPVTHAVPKPKRITSPKKETVNTELCECENSYQYDNCECPDETRQQPNPLQQKHFPNQECNCNEYGIQTSSNKQQANNECVCDYVQPKNIRKTQVVQKQLPRPATNNEPCECEETTHQSKMPNQQQNTCNCSQIKRKVAIKPPACDCSEGNRSQKPTPNCTCPEVRNPVVSSTKTNKTPGINVLAQPCDCSVGKQANKLCNCLPSQVNTTNKLPVNNKSTEKPCDGVQTRKAESYMRIPMTFENDFMLENLNACESEIPAMPPSECQDDTEVCEQGTPQKYPDVMKAKNASEIQTQKNEDENKQEEQEEEGTEETEEVDEQNSKSGLAANVRLNSRMVYGSGLIGIDD